MSIWQALLQGGVISIAVAVLLLLMSVTSWMVIIWKSMLLWRASRDVAHCTARFWQAPSWQHGVAQLQTTDREQIVLPLIVAAHTPTAGTLAAAGDRSQQLTRLLRDALHRVLNRLQSGQVVLASIGAVAPFVGLLGTVWGIYHALIGIAAAGQMQIEQIAGPVGEALVMTAVGLVVAIPAVLAFNVLGRQIAKIEADLEGFAHDLREMLLADNTVAQPET
jgi:biopolymer transport protein ExbB